jgi:hypothetical protein
MATVSITQLANGTTADAVAVDANFNALAAQVNGNLDATNIKSGGITTDMIATNGVAAANLATSAITLGYAQITTGTATNSSSSYVLATGLTATVTIPAGGRKIRITAWTRAMQNAVAATNNSMSIWDGTVGSGTQLAECFATCPASNGLTQMTCVAVVSPAAGAKTYNVGYAGNGQNGAITASATAPAFILVEAI